MCSSFTNSPIFPLLYYQEIMNEYKIQISHNFKIPEIPEKSLISCVSSCFFTNEGTASIST